MEKNSIIEERRDYRQKHMTRNKIEQYILMLAGSNLKSMSYTGFDEKRDFENLIGEELSQEEFDELKNRILRDVINSQVMLYNLINQLNGGSVKYMMLFN